MLELAQFTFNSFMEHTYVLYHRATREAYVIDPGCHSQAEQEELYELLDSEQLRVKACLLTHAHIDHVVGLAGLQSKYKCRAYLHAEAQEHFTRMPEYATFCGISDYIHGTIDAFLKEGEVLPIGDTALSIRKVPGHAPGHVVFYNEPQKLLIAGDTLFYNSIGRTDFPGGDHETLLHAIRTELYSLPDDVQVWPGHGECTRIGHEKRNNPFVQPI